MLMHGVRVAVTGGDPWEMMAQLVRILRSRAGTAQLVCPLGRVSARLVSISSQGSSQAVCL